MDALSEEVWRVITAPYTVSLQRLHTILGGVQQYELRRWANGRCNLEALAIAIVESLQQSPYALTILQKLSCILPFRDAVLNRKPILLQSLLSKAVASDQGFQQYAVTCVALLSSPLIVPLPAEISDFFSAIVQCAIDFPSAETTRPIHVIISGIGARILETLAPGSLSRLQGQLIKIVSRMDKDSHDMNALCLAILAHMASTEPSTDIASSTSSITSADQGNDRADLFESARKLFVDKNVPRILDFAFGRARWACSPNVSETVAHRMEVLELCKRTIGPTNAAARQSWLYSKSSLSRKVNEHVNREGLHAEVRCIAFDFIAAVHDPKSIPEDTAKAVREFFGARNDVHCSQMLVENYMAQLDERSMAVELLRLLQLAIEENVPSQRSLSELNVAVSLVNGLAASCSTSRDVRQKILYSLSTNEFSLLLQRFSEFEPTGSSGQHTKSGICPKYFADYRQKYHRTVCCLILRTGLHAADDELSIDTSLAMALLKKGIDIPDTSLSCRIPSPPRLSSGCTEVSLFETGSTPQDMASRRWRDQLTESLSRDAAYQHQHIVKTMGEVCQDLEVRCENAEKPFREEQVKSRDLRAKLAEVEARNAELVAKMEGYDHTINDLKVQICQRKEQANAAQERSTALIADLQVLQQEVERTKEQATSATKASSEVARQQDLTYVSIIKGKDEVCQEQSDKIKTLEVQTNDLTRKIAECQQLEASITGQKDRLEESLAQRTNGLENAEAQANARLADISRLQEANEGLVATNASINAELSEAAECRDHLASKLETHILAFDSERIELHTRHDESIAAKAAEIEQLIQSHESTMRKFRKDRETTERTAERAAKQSNIKVKELEKKVGTLRREFANQGMVLAEYRDFNNRMTKLQTRHQSLNYPMMEGVAGDDDQSKVIACDAEESPMQHDDEANLTTSFGSTTSSRSGGPTPKRTKTGSRRSFKPPTTITRAPSLATPLRRATTGFTVKGQRQALGNLGSASQNEVLLTPTQPLTSKTPRRHTSAAIGDNDENERPVEEGGYGEMSFDNSDIFTSTSKQRLEIVQDYAARDDCGETTADI